MHPGLPTCASRLSGKLNNGVCLHFQLQAVFPSCITPLVSAFIITNDSPFLIVSYLLNYSSFSGSREKKAAQEPFEGGVSVCYVTLGLLDIRWFTGSSLWCKPQGCLMQGTHSLLLWKEHPSGKISPHQVPLCQGWGFCKSISLALQPVLMFLLFFVVDKYSADSQVLFREN